MLHPIRILMLMVTKEFTYEVCLQLTISTPEFLKAKRFRLKANDIFATEYAY